MNENRNNLPPVLRPNIWNRRIEIRSKFILYPSVSLFFLIVLLAVYGAGCFDSNRVKVDKWLEFHQLARLPQLTTNIMYYQWNGLFTGETYIKFQMPSNDLTNFIANSLGGLSRGKSDIFTPEHPYLPYRSRTFPDWFDLTITNQGRGYILDRGPNSEVYINEETATVYLRSIKG